MARVQNNNGLAAQAKKPTFSQAITGPALQNLIRKSVPDARSAARLTGTLLSVVAQTPALQKCSPASIVAAALRGEGAGLQITRDYHVVPFGNTAVYVPGYKGLLTLLMATGEVEDADCIAVHEGELIGRDKRTKRPVFDFSIYETDEEEKQHPVIGYYFYVQFTNGSFRFKYMSVGEILDHADRYVQSFERAKYEQMIAGELPEAEVESLKNKTRWYSDTDTMMRKTVIRNLLNSGYVPIANTALREELIADEASKGDGIIPDLDTPTYEAPVDTVEAEEVTDISEPAPAPKKPAQASTGADDGAIEGFFD